MVAGTDACHCDVCGYVCTGRFGGCAGVWARGPRDVTFTPRPTPGVRRPRLALPVTEQSPAGSDVAALPAPPAPAPSVSRVDSALRDIRAELSELARQIGQHNVALDRVIERMDFVPVLEKLGAALPDHVAAEVRRELAGLPLLHEDLVAELRRTTSTVAAVSADIDAKFGRLTDEILAQPSGAHAAGTTANPKPSWLPAKPRWAKQIFNQEE